MIDPRTTTSIAAGAGGAFLFTPFVVSLLSPRSRATRSLYLKYLGFIYVRRSRKPSLSSYIFFLCGLIASRHWPPEHRRNGLLQQRSVVSH